MKKHLIILSVALLLICVGLSGCNENNPLASEESRFVGTWQGTSVIMGTSGGNAAITFLSDGTFSLSLSMMPGSGTWDIKDNKLVLTGAGGILTFSYVFSSSDKALTLTSTTSDLQLIMTKQ